MLCSRKMSHHFIFFSLYNRSFDFAAKQKLCAVNRYNCCDLLWAIWIFFTLTAATVVQCLWQPMIMQLQPWLQLWPQPQFKTISTNHVGRVKKFWLQVMWFARKVKLPRLHILCCKETSLYLKVLKGKKCIIQKLGFFSVIVRTLPWVLD